MWDENRFGRWFTPYYLLFFLLIAFGTARIIDTYQSVSVTSDERLHISAGVQWLVDGVYSYEELHPPLARIFAALLPHLAGLTAFELQGWEVDGDSVLLQTKRPETALMLARLGNVPFFVIACVIVCLWGKQLGGEKLGLASLIIFSFSPTILAMGGVATTDMALCAMVTASMFVYWQWLRARSTKLTAALGLFVGLSVLSKFTALIFLPVGFVALLVGNIYITSRNAATKERKTYVLYHLTSAVLIAFLIVWSGYRFSFAPINIHITESMLPLVWSSKIVSVPVPAPELFRGLWMLFNQLMEGKPSYLINESSMSGWWYFFPVAIFFKMPIVVTILISIGLIGATVGKQRSMKTMFPIVLAFLALLVVVMPSSLNSVRYVLPLFPLISLVASSGLLQLTEILWSKAIGYLLVFISLALITVSSILQHPNYITYFNILEKNIDGPVLLASDRDWGQALGYLEEYVDRQQISPIHVINSGMLATDIETFSLHRFRYLPPGQKVSGWVAAGYTKVFLDEGYKWLQAYDPIVILEKSILVYYIPD